jgi:hypothetical protein
VPKCVRNVVFTLSKRVVMSSGHVDFGSMCSLSNL